MPKQASLFEVPQRTAEIPLAEADRTEKKKRLPRKAAQRDSPDGVSLTEPDRQQAILLAAFEIFAEQGYAATRMDDVAAKAGVAKGLIYFYFTNKEKLFEAVVRERIFLPLSTLSLEKNPAESMARRLTRILAQLYQSTAGSPFFYRVVRLMLIDGGKFPQAHQIYYTEILLPVMELFQECLAEGHRRGEWEVNDIPEFVQILVAPSILLTLWKMAIERYHPLDAQRYALDHQRVLLRSLRLSDEAIEEALTGVWPTAAQPGPCIPKSPASPLPPPAQEKKNPPRVRRTIASVRRKQK